MKERKDKRGQGGKGRAKDRGVEEVRRGECGK